MDARQLEYFLAVVEQGGITPAAAALHLSQPSLSQAIRKLEAELGTELLHRVNRGVVLSAAGEALVGPARQVLRDLRTARESVQAVRGLSGGRLDIATLSTLAVDPVARLVGRFRRRHPDVTLRLVDPVDATAVAELVRTGECELGVTDAPRPGAGLDVLPFGQQKLVVALPPRTSLPDAALPGADLLDAALPDADLPGADLLDAEGVADLPWVVSPPGTSTRSLLEQTFDGFGAAPRIVVETAHREAVIPLVLAGAGATLLPEPLAREAARRGAIVRGTRPPITRQLALVHRDGPLSPAAAAFVAQFRARAPVGAGRPRRSPE